MNRILKMAVMSVALGATTLATLPAADARDWRHHNHHNSHGGDAVIAGVAGLAAGALIAGALSQPRYDSYDDGYYDEPSYVVRRRPVLRPAPVREYGRVAYDGGIEPWTRDWYEYCSDRYRTFNARTGTFTGNDGDQHFCVAN